MESSVKAGAGPVRDAHALFRQEVFTHLGARRLGSVIITTPASQFAITAFIFVLISAVLAYLFFADYAQKVSVSGVLVPGAGFLRVAAPQAGTVKESWAYDGRKVAKGERLFLLSSERTVADGGSAARQISQLLAERRDSLRAELAQIEHHGSQQIASLRQRLRDLAQEAAHLDRQIALQKRRVTLAEETLARFNELHGERFVSPLQLHDKEIALLEQTQKLEELTRSRVNIDRERNGAQADLRNQEEQLARSRGTTERNIASTEQDLLDNEAKRETLVVAPMDGVVTLVGVETGQAVSADLPLATIIPADAALEAELYVPSRAVGFLKVGDTVQLRYRSFPYQRFGQHPGQVREVAAAGARTEDNPRDFAALARLDNAGEALFKVRVKLASQRVAFNDLAYDLKPGMMLDATIASEKRRLFEWVNYAVRKGGEAKS